MHLPPPTTLMLPLLTTTPINILQSNDDGWAELNIRTLYTSLTTSPTPYNILLSAPARNKSGTGSKDSPPQPLGPAGCEFASCPPHSAPYGFNASNPRLNYINSYPVTSMRHGIRNLSATYFDGEKPDIAVSGVNVGTNLGWVTGISGTVGAAVEAVREGVPAIAFSGESGRQEAWDVIPVPGYARVYGELGARVTDAVVEGGKPYLPPNVWLNVNFPRVKEGCEEVEDFRFVLSRIGLPIVGDDVEVCGNGGHLPTENEVLDADECFASISVGRADTKRDASKQEQAVVLNRLGKFLTCLPEY